MGEGDGCLFCLFFFRIHKNGRCYFNDGKYLPLGCFFLPFELGNLVKVVCFLGFLNGCIDSP